MGIPELARESNTELEFPRGFDTEDIFKRFIGGLAGSAMPAFEGDSFPGFGLTAEESQVA